jgi:hypothetical protein
MVFKDVPVKFDGDVCLVTGEVKYPGLRIDHLTVQDLLVTKESFYHITSNQEFRTALINKLSRIAGGTQAILN